MEKIRILHKCHVEIAADITKYGRYMGLALKVLSAVIAISIFTALTRTDNTLLLILTGIISIIMVNHLSANQFFKIIRTCLAP